MLTFAITGIGCGTNWCLVGHQKQIPWQQLHGGECLKQRKEFESGREENEKRSDSQEDINFEPGFAWKNCFSVLSLNRLN